MAFPSTDSFLRLYIFFSHLSFMWSENCSYLLILWFTFPRSLSFLSDFSGCQGGRQRRTKHSSDDVNTSSSAAVQSPRFILLPFLYSGSWRVTPRQYYIMKHSVTAPFITLFRRTRWVDPCSSRYSVTLPSTSPPSHQPVIQTHPDHGNESLVLQRISCDMSFTCFLIPSW